VRGALPSGRKRSGALRGTIYRGGDQFTFHRSHKPHTFARWAEAVPEGFRFAVKMPKRISHELRLLGTGDPLRRFWEEVRDLDPKLGPLLLQLPPSLVYDPVIVEPFFELLRASTNHHPIVCEPRHPTWFDVEADGLLEAYAIARAAADPARVPAAGRPGGDVRFAYYRLHGAPRMSSHSPSSDRVTVPTPAPGAPFTIHRRTIVVSTATHSATPRFMGTAGGADPTFSSHPAGINGRAGRVPLPAIEGWRAKRVLWPLATALRALPLIERAGAH
jgi:hypothetical protein